MALLVSLAWTWTTKRRHLQTRRTKGPQSLPVPSAVLWVWLQSSHWYAMRLGGGARVINIPRSRCTRKMSAPMSMEGPLKTFSRNLLTRQVNSQDKRGFCDGYTAREVRERYGPLGVFKSLAAIDIGQSRRCDLTTHSWFLERPLLRGSIYRDGFDIPFPRLFLILAPRTLHLI